MSEGGGPHGARKGGPTVVPRERRMEQERADYGTGGPSQGPPILEWATPQGLAFQHHPSPTGWRPHVFRGYLWEVPPGAFASPKSKWARRRDLTPSTTTRGVDSYREAVRPQAPTCHCEAVRPWQSRIWFEPHAENRDCFAPLMTVTGLCAHNGRPKLLMVLVECTTRSRCPSHLLDGLEAPSRPASPSDPY